MCFMGLAYFSIFFFQFSCTFVQISPDLQLLQHWFALFYSRQPIYQQKWSIQFVIWFITQNRQPIHNIITYSAMPRPPSDTEQPEIARDDSQPVQPYWFFADVQISYSLHQVHPEDEDSDISHITYGHSSDEDSSYYHPTQPTLHFQSNPQPPSQHLHADMPQSPPLTPEQIDSLPRMTWGIYNCQLNSLQKCSICLSNYAKQQSLRVLHCLHRFHEECLDRWLLGSRTCPQCRQDVIGPG